MPGLINKYGPEIRWDLQRYLGIDLDDFLTGERHWATFLELLEQLPPGSHYIAALADDDDLAEQMLAARKGSPEAPPSLRDWDATQSKLTALLDGVQALCALTARMESAPPPMPRPVTAADRLEQARKDKKRDGALMKLLGDRFEP